MRKYHRDVFVISDGKTTQVIRVDSTAPIDAYGTLNAASRELPAQKTGESRYLKVYCGGQN